MRARGEEVGANRAICVNVKKKKKKMFDTEDFFSSCALSANQIRV